MAVEMNQTSVLDALRDHPFTAGMGGAQLDALADRAELVEIEADERVFGSGERAKYFYILLSGTAFLELETPVYRVTIQELGSGEAFGWSALVDQPYRAFQVRARAACRVIRIPGDHLLRACEGDDRLGSLVFRRLAEIVARRLRATELRFAEFCGTKSEVHMPASPQTP
jgi:CRP-like cAMP-binding protein